MPIVKTILFSISQDSEKHAALLLGTTRSAAVSLEKPKDSAKKMVLYGRQLTHFIEKSKRKEISNWAVLQLSEKLEVFEDT
jgi:hypothetical protein